MSRDQPKTYNSKRRFSPAMWRRLLERQQEQHPHAEVLAAGIRWMRGALEARSVSQQEQREVFR